MRRHLFLPVVLLVTVVLSLVVILTIAGSFRQEGLLFGSKMSDYSAGWETSGGVSVSLPGTLPGADGGPVLLTNALPELTKDGTVLLLKTSYQFLRVSVDGKEIYAWDPPGGTSIVRPFGLPCYLVSLPTSAAGKPIVLSMTPSGPGGNLTVYDVSVGSGVSAAISLITQNQGTAYLFAVLAVLFILIAASALLFRKRLPAKNTYSAYYMAGFIALAAIWILSDSDLLLLFTPNIAGTLYSAMFSLMLLPAPILLFVRLYAQHGKRLLNVLTALVLLNFFVCLCLMLTGAVDPVRTLFTPQILILLSCVVIFLICLNEIFRNKRREMAEVFVGLVCLCLFTAATVVMFVISGNPRITVLAYTGVTVFILAIGSGLVRRGIGELARSKSYVELTMAIPSGICRIDSYETGRIVFANEFYYTMFGYTEEEARDAGFDSDYFTVLPEDLPSLKDKIRMGFETNLSRFETEARHVRRDGVIIWVLARYRMERFGAITLVLIDITDRKRAEEKLRISEEEYRIATHHSNKLIIRLDIKTRTAYRQADDPTLFGVPSVLENVPESLLTLELLAQDSVETFRGFYDAIYRGDKEGNAVVSIYDRKAGEYRWYRYDFSTIFDDGGEPAQAIITFYDVTLLRQKELAFQRWQQNYNAIPKSATNSYEYNLTDNRIEHEEGGMLPPVPEEIPRSLPGFADYISERLVCAEDRAVWYAFMSRDRLLGLYAAGQHTQKIEFRRLAEGKAKWTTISVQLIPDPYCSDVKGYFLLEDIDARKKAELDLQERSTTDSLTGLLNRATFVEKFNEILNGSDLETQHSLIMLDIDKFKTINDTLGHGAGDSLLISIAGKLKYALRSDDLCGRLGGDEFVICLKSMNHGKSLETRAEDLCAMICDDSVTASFGIASFPSDGLSFDELYRKADIALYKAKAQGRGGFAVYDPQLSFDDMAAPAYHG